MSSLATQNFQGQKVLIRVDFNVPVKDGVIKDDTRIRASLPTIRAVLENHGSVILMSHLGRPLRTMAKDPKLRPADFSLAPLVAPLSRLLNRPVSFAKDCIGKEAEEKAKALQPGEVLLLENLRLHPEEEKGAEPFARQLAQLGDSYINDAFGTAHRAHASTAVMAKYFSSDKKQFGMLMQQEIQAAEKILQSAQKPFAAIIGGAKVSDKILIIENLMDRATDIIIGGGMAYTFFKAKGGAVGNSLCENDRLDTARELLNKAQAKGVTLHLPEDSIIADRFSADAQTRIADNMEIPDGWMGLDIGPKATATFRTVILKAKTLLWNGPMGVFEMEKFQSGTQAVAEAVKDATREGAYSLVGGGDSVAAVNKFGYADQVSYVSTGGGALLEYFEGKKLPGIAAIKDNK